MRVLWALTLLPAACKQERVEMGPAATVALSAEAFAALPLLRLEMTGPLCAAEEPRSGCELGPTGDVVSNGRSLLLLNDPSQKTLRLIDATTGSTRSLGRLGQGPGEFRVIFSIGLGQVGQAAAFDGEQRKTISFDSTGRASEVRHSSLPGGVVAMDFINGELWAVGGDINGNTATGDSVQMLLFRVRGNGDFQQAATLALRRQPRIEAPAPILRQGSGTLRATADCSTPTAAQ
ncbi:MAG: hypothetical protein IPO52_12425 [Gemmatimonadetes bacterium]|nr:hypothetical protein [Gemmatimonadota bacterium]